MNHFYEYTYFQYDKNKILTENETQYLCFISIPLKSHTDSTYQSVIIRMNFTHEWTIE